jgi:hypothetical protein
MNLRVQLALLATVCLLASAMARRQTTLAETTERAQEWKPCPVGFYNITIYGHQPEPGNPAVCLPCSPGTYNQYSSATQPCKACLAGTWSPAQASVCTNCASGLVSQASAAYCYKYCQRGQGHPTAAGVSSATSSNPIAYNACTACARGFYSAVTGDTLCTPCLAGQYATKTGLSACTSCPSGTYSTAAMSTCYTCEQNNVAPEGSSKCTPCGVLSHPNEAKSECVCNPGTYRSGTDGLACYPCPPPFTLDMTGTQCGCPPRSFKISSAAGAGCQECPPGTTSGFNAEKCAAPEGAAPKPKF